MDSQEEMEVTKAQYEQQMNQATHLANGLAQ
jgi:hypothetical protein